MGTLHEDQYTFLITFRSILLRMRNVSDKICREIQNTHFISVSFFFKNCAICEIMWKYIVELGVLQVTIWHMHITYWISKSTNAHSEYVICIAFPLYQCLHECASVLCNMNIAHLVGIYSR
jgi:hypothetical protein